MNQQSENDRDFLLRTGETYFRELRNRRIFLTGGTGFFGKWFLESFAVFQEVYGWNAELVVLSRNPKAFLEKWPRFANLRGVTFVSGDVREVRLPEQKVDYVIHAATEASAMLEKENPDEMYSVVTDGTRNVLEIAKRCGAERFLLTSSGAVYGSQPPELYGFPEDYAGEPTTAYGKGKLRAEAMVQESGVPCSVARCFAFVGPYLNLDIHFAVGNFIRNGLNREPLVIRGDGTPYRSYLYAAELVSWLWTILLKSENHAVYNVGSEEAVSIRDLAEAVAAAFPYPLEVSVLQKPDATKPASRYVPDVSKIERELGLTPQISLSEGIRRTIAFHQSNLTMPHRFP